MFFVFFAVNLVLYISFKVKDFSGFFMVEIESIRGRRVIIGLFCCLFFKVYFEVDDFRFVIEWAVFEFLIRYYLFLNYFIA